MAGFSGHAIYPLVYAKMEDKSQFPLLTGGCPQLQPQHTRRARTSIVYSAFSRFLLFLSVLLNTSVSVILVCGILYSSVGLCGYLTCGDATSDQITVNMPLNFVGDLCIFCVIAISFCKFSLTVAPIALGLEDLLGYSIHGDLVDGFGPQFASFTIRTTIVVTATFAAIWTPNFALLASIMGAVLVNLLSTILPPFFYIATKLRGLVQPEAPLGLGAVHIISMGLALACSIFGCYGGFVTTAQIVSGGH